MTARELPDISLLASVGSVETPQLGAPSQEYTEVQTF